MKQYFASVCNSLSWGLFAVVAVMLLVSVMVSDIIACILAPMGLLFALVVLVIDIFNKMLWKKGQVFKMFINFMLLTKTCVLYKYDTAALVAASLDFVMIFILVIFFSQEFNRLVEDVKEANSKEL